MGRAQISQDERAIAPQLDVAAAGRPALGHHLSRRHARRSPRGRSSAWCGRFRRGSPRSTSTCLSPRRTPPRLEIGRERSDGALVKTGDKRAELRSRRADRRRRRSWPIPRCSPAPAAGRCPASRSTRAPGSTSAPSASPRRSATFRPTGSRSSPRSCSASATKCASCSRGSSARCPASCAGAAAIMPAIEFVQRLPISRLNAWLAAQSAPETDDAPWSPPVISKS